MVPPVLAAWFRCLQTSVRILESLIYEFIPRAKFPAAMGFQAANNENLDFPSSCSFQSLKRSETIVGARFSNRFMKRID
jgi:hypothetical protein